MQDLHDPTDRNQRDSSKEPCSGKLGSSVDKRDHDLLGNQAEPLASRRTTAHARELGFELQLARKRSQTTGVNVCGDLGWSTAKLGKIESGARGASAWDIATLLGCYLGDRETRDRLRALASESETGHFVRCHGERVPESLTVVAMHEQMASAIATFDPSIVPSLVQSADYARELLRSRSDGDGMLEDLVKDRMRRHEELLYSHESPEVVVFLAETAMRTPLGGAALMHCQLMRLILLTKADNVIIRVIPSREMHESLRHGGTYLKLRRLPAVVYSEIDLMTVVYDDAKLVGHWVRKLKNLEELALSPADSLEALLRCADAYDRYPSPQRGWDSSTWQMPGPDYSFGSVA